MAYGKIVATYQAATPVYLGNERPETPATRLREASFKGVLRFWWRALFWQAFWERAGSDEEQALKLLRQAEGELFGAASDKGASTGRQALFRLRSHVEHKGREKDNPSGIGWNYLLGQGLGGRTPAFHAGAIFRVELLLKPGLTAAQEGQLLKALVALGLFGGIGARSRRGVGSLCIHALTAESVKLPDHAVPSDARQLAETCKWLGLPATCPQPPYSAFSQDARVWAQKLSSPIKTGIEKFGYAFQQYRSYHTETGNPNFPEDHHEMLKAVRGTPPAKAPKRAIFGMPHNYFFKSEYDKLCRQFRRNGMREKEARRKAASYAKASLNFPNGDDRRASPFFIHGHIFPIRNETAIIQTLLPAPFPSNVVKVRTKRLGKSDDVPFDSSGWIHITNFSDGLKGNIQLFEQ